MESNFFKGAPAAETESGIEQQAIVEYFKKAQTVLAEGFTTLPADPTQRMMKMLLINANLGTAIAVGETLALTGHTEGAHQTLELLKQAATKFERTGEQLTPGSQTQLYVLRQMIALSNEHEDAARYLNTPITTRSVKTIIEPAEQKKRKRFMSSINERVLNARLLAYIADTQDLATLNNARQNIPLQSNDLAAADASSMVFESFDSLVTAGLSADADTRDKLRTTLARLSETAARLLPSYNTFKELHGYPLHEETAPGYRLFIQEYAAFESDWMALRLDLLSYLDDAALDKLYS